MRILIDTNVLIDFVSMRAPYEVDAIKILDACDKSIIDGCIAAHSISNMEYILRKSIPLTERREMLLYLCSILEVSGIDKYKLTRALTNESFTDFEDCLQSLCAADCRADYIVTRNPKDFSGSIVPIIQPNEFCQQFLSTDSEEEENE